MRKLVPPTSVSDQPASSVEVRLLIMGLQSLIWAGLLLFVLAFTPTHGGYVITTPRRWIPGFNAKVCVTVKDRSAPSGSVLVTVSEWVRPPPGNTLETLTNKSIILPQGHSNECQDVEVPSTYSSEAMIRMRGSAGGIEVNHLAWVSLKRYTTKTFLQTDKYLYKPGQLVQIRTLTIAGPKMAVSTQQYPEIWVTSPSRTRIAQWKNVDNSAGLIHLDFRLADEPETGIYVVHVSPPEGNDETVNFKVNEFVLPRFEVTIKEPKYILATDKEFNFTVCAKYTFGQNVKGNLTVAIYNKKRSSRCSVYLTRNYNISGCQDVTITSAEMKINPCTVNRLKVTANVFETGTEVEADAEKETSITKQVVKFATLNKDEFRKPNLPYTIVVKATLPDNAPAAGESVDVCVTGICNMQTTDTKGLITAIMPSTEETSLYIKSMNARAHMSAGEYRESLRNIPPQYSPSNSSLLIYAPEQKLACQRGQSKQHTLKVIFSARDQPTADITVQVVSQGRIQYSKTDQFQLVEGPLSINTDNLNSPIEGTVRGVFDINLTLPPTSSQTVKVLVWYTRDDDEVVSDTRELKVDRCLDNEVSLQWSVQRAYPGEEATVKLTSAPEALCSLGVVDRSVELLSEEPDPITLDALFNFVDGFKVNPNERKQTDDQKYCLNKHKDDPQGATGYSTDGYVDALKMFDNAGVYVFSNYTLETRPCRATSHSHSHTQRPRPLDSDSPFGGGFAAASRPHRLPTTTPVHYEYDYDAPQALSISTEVEVETVRTNFPETWMWDLVIVPPSGVSEQPVTVPDTITQWVGKAVCVHPQKGVGLSNRETITAFTPFFVDLTLPPTVKRGEILPVKMSVFNYLEQQLPVSLILEESTEYEILDETVVEGTSLERGKRSACIPPQDKTVLTIRIKALKIADVNLSVIATVDQQSRPGCGEGATAPVRTDALIKPIKVEAEGYLRENTWTKYICAEDLTAGEDSLESWDLTLPAKLVEGSARGWVTAVGNLLALSLENLGHLIRMPYGCGEQNMVNFAPNIYVLRYLENANQNTPEAREKLIRFMNSGYQRQLRYRRYDGSYSAFGSRDDEGSTFLSAFVLKSFAQAKKYIHIDEDRQKETSKWLLDQQLADGCFISVGKLLNKALQGGAKSSSTPTPLTAYVMAALLEAGEDPVSVPVRIAAQCLTEDTSTHPYTMALKAYALALGKRPEAGEAVRQLMDKAIVTTNSTHWELPAGQGNSKAAALETAGYAILAMMTYDPENMRSQALKVVKWITAQRNGQGGFYSTQDTVVALQAMALYESHLHQGPLNVQATVTGGNYSFAFTVNDDNKLLQQLEPLPHMPTTLTLSVSGQGCAILQAVQRYNLPEPEPSDAFALTVNTITVPDNHCVTKRITACAKYNLPDSKSNMAVIEVDLISGYIPEKRDLKQMLRDDANIKRYEVDGSKTTFYIHELTGNDTCVNFRVLREVDVEQVKPGSVTVYDYYQPEFSLVKRYTLPPNEECR